MLLLTRRSQLSSLYCKLVSFNRVDHLFHVDFDYGMSAQKRHIGDFCRG